MTETLRIKSDRLIIRTLVKEDAEVFYNYRSDANSNQYQSWIPKSIPETLDFIKNKVSPTFNVLGTWSQLAITIKESGELIGDIGIHFLDSDSYQVEIGYTLNKDYQGKGYAVEAIKEAISYLFKDLNKRRIIASIDPRNSKSIKLAERLGFRKEAHFRESLLINGQWEDDLIYAVLKSEWKY